MVNLTKASRELFSRPPDECFESLDALIAHCSRLREQSADRWQPPREIRSTAADGPLRLQLGPEDVYSMNDWSFTQLCRLAGVAKDTVNRLSPDTADQVLRETLPFGNRPIQLLTTDEMVRSIHGVSYSRLWNADLLTAIREEATDFSPPPKGANGGTGLYCGEQDMFSFLIDPAGWIEIGEQTFAPGFFVWNSEVGRRSVGIQTFWFQAVCQNHIVWDAVEVVEFTRKHTGNVADSLGEIRRIVGNLVAKRDARRDEFARVIQKAIQEKVGKDDDEAKEFLTHRGIPRHLVKKAVETISRQGAPFTLWSLVDVLTQLTGAIPFAGDRTEADQKVAKLLAVAA